tara:strand:- start:1617 stop:1964 length:348 start_codon:yes stop_codon:yes gene_type:complete
MNAIVKISGKQYRVSKGDIFKTNRQEWKIGDKVKINDILLTENKGKISVGNPIVRGASVTVKILEHSRDKKILIYKKKRRKGYQRKNGHRQGNTLLEVVKIDAKSPEKPKKKEAK